jgi:hypothetical protein
MRIKRFEDYHNDEEMAYLFLNSFEQLIKESSEEEYEKIQKKVLRDLKINFEFIATFGAGINFLFPIVEGLLFNQGNIEVTKESVVLATICALGIIYLEEKKSKSQKSEEQLRKDSKSILEELKLKGIGNGIVKKIIKAIKSINNIFIKIGEYLGKVTLGIIDMFAYTSLLIPVMNGIMAIVNKYDLNLDTIAQNLIGIGMGVATIVAKNGIIEIVKRLKGKISDKKKKEIINDIEEEPLSIEQEPIIKKFGELHDDDTELIKEQ